MAESQRKHNSGAAVLEGDKNKLHDNITLIGFLIGAIGIVAGMLWLANGLSENFDLNTTSFITFAVCMSITTVLFALNRFVIKD